MIDWFHIPLQSKRAINKGYAFINFRDHRYIPAYVYALTGLKFPGYRTNKCVAIEFSSKQIRAKSQYSEKRHVDHEGPIFLDHFAAADLESILIPPGKTSGYFGMPQGSIGSAGPMSQLSGTYSQSSMGNPGGMPLSGPGNGMPYGYGGQPGSQSTDYTRNDGSGVSHGGIPEHQLPSL